MNGIVVLIGLAVLLLVVSVVLRSRSGGRRDTNRRGSETSGSASSAAIGNRQRQVDLVPVVVRLRDGDNCRSCGGRVAWQGPTSKQSAEFHWTDPGNPDADADSLVVLCRSCNAKVSEGIGVPIIPPPSEPYYSWDTARYLTRSGRPTVSPDPIPEDRPESVLGRRELDRDQGGFVGRVDDVHEDAGDLLSGEGQRDPGVLRGVEESVDVPPVDLEPVEPEPEVDAGLAGVEPPVMRVGPVVERVKSVGHDGPLFSRAGRTSESRSVAGPLGPATPSGWIKVSPVAYRDPRLALASSHGDCTADEVFGFLVSLAHGVDIVGSARSIGRAELLVRRCEQAGLMMFDEEARQMVLAPGVVQEVTA